MQFSFSKNLNIFLIVISILLAILLLRRGCNNCQEYPKPISQLTHDTTYLKSKPVEIKVPAPYPRYIYRSIDTATYDIIIDDSLYSPYAEGYKDATEAFIKARHTCRDTAYYIDTIISEDKWKMVLLESLTGNRIISRKPYVEDLRPIITTSITTQLPSPKEHIRFYAGAEASINANYANRWGLGLAGIVTIPRGYAFRYGYDLRNNAHTAGLYALIRLKK